MVKIMESKRRVKFGKGLIFAVLFATMVFVIVSVSVGCVSAALTSQGTTQLTTNSTDDIYPSWSLDGSKILFASNRSGNYDIWAMDSDGLNKVQLTANSADEKYPVWNHAGDKIVFTRYNSSARDGWGAYQLWIMNSDGTNQQRLNINETWCDQFSPTWSPDDSKIAFVSFGPSGNLKIYVYVLSTATVTNVTPVDQEINPYGAIARVSWGSTNRIAYDRWWLGIQTINSTGGDFQRITNIYEEGGIPVEADWSHDAAKFVFSFLEVFPPYTPSNLAYAVNTTNTTEMTILENTTSEDTWPSWNPTNESEIVFVSDRSGNHDVWLMTVVATMNNPPYTPSNQSPANHATNVSINAALSWTGGDPDAGDTVTYDVYFDTTDGTTLVSSNQTAVTYDPGTLNYNTTYYWKIVATDNHEGFTEGDVCEFSTEAAPGAELEPPYAKFHFNKDFGVHTEEDAILNGTYESDIWYCMNIENVDDTSDTVLGNLSFSAHADNLTDVDWEEYTEWNETSVEWNFPYEEFIIGEDDNLWTGFGTSYSETRDVNVNLSRWMNITEFNFDAYQLAEFTVTFRSRDFMWCEGGIGASEHHEVRASIVPDTFNTTAPLSWIDVEEQGVYFDFNKSQIQTDVPYNFTVVIKVELTGNEAPPILYKPSFSINRYIYYDESALAGKRCTAEMPEDMLPDNVSYASVTTNVSNYWTLLRHNRIIVGLEEVSESGTSMPHTPSNPSPENHATNVSIDAALSWSGGDPDAGDTVTYDVYFDTTDGTTLVSSNQTAATYDPGTLNYNTTYYWKIVATDNHGASTEGTLWDFGTEAEAAPGAWSEDKRLTEDDDIDSRLPAVAINGNSVYVVWTDHRDGNDEIYFKKSSDSGITWGSDVRLTNTSKASDYPDITVSPNGHIHVVWRESHGNPQPWQVHYMRSEDGGNTWVDVKQLTAYSASYIYHYCIPAITSDNNRLYLVWHDNREGGWHNPYYKISTDGGTTWSADTRLSNERISSQSPSVASDGSGGVQVVFTSTNGATTNSRIYYKKSLNWGSIWGSDVRLCSGSGTSSAPSVAVDGNNVQVIWMCDCDKTGSYELYYRKSSDRGTTWGSEVQLTETDGNSSCTSGFNKVIAVVGEKVCVVWMDQRDGNWEIYYKESTDGGATWSDDVRLTDDPATSYCPDIAATTDEIQVVWQDERDGNYEIYYKRSGSGVTATIKGDLNGDGTLTPADAMIALEIAVGSRPCDDAMLTAADVSGDGRVTSLDALMILQAATGGIAL